jgi:ribosomal protein S14
MLSLKIKDLKNRNLYIKNEKKSVINRFLFINLLNQKTNKQTNLFILFILLQQNKNSKLCYKVRTKIVRRCAISNRGRANFRPYGISRFFLRDFMQFGVLPGFKKAVW